MNKFIDLKGCLNDPIKIKELNNFCVNLLEEDLNCNYVSKTGDVNNIYVDNLFLRCFSMLSMTFTNVVFRNIIFDNVFMKNCKFNGCTIFGIIFSSMIESCSFINCDLEYLSFSHNIYGNISFIDSHINN